ncbi:unnamed protein product [Penicillium camemberti]|uniref:Str. FM013 n=1 Tax=Penicillium camemberti (strain FM 013) TaxID=1429867 RepID=A0A0G4NW84_PENC3|nr:unnamed protein product [Penicillium camemberti]
MSGPRRLWDPFAVCHMGPLGEDKSCCGICTALLYKGACTAILVVACRLEGRWEEAEQLFVQAIETSKTKLGPDHSLTLTSVANLAFTWESIGQHAKAIGLLRTCMEATTSFCPCCRMTIHF